MNVAHAAGLFVHPVVRVGTAMMADSVSSLKIVKRTKHELQGYSI